MAVCWVCQHAASTVSDAVMWGSPMGMWAHPRGGDSPHERRHGPDVLRVPTLGVVRSPATSHDPTRCVRDTVAIEPITESLAAILQRIEERYIKPSHTPSSPRTVDSPPHHATRGASHLANATTAPWPVETTAIPAEVFLETLGFFTPSSKRLRGIYTKEKTVGARVEADGTTRLIQTKISANHELGLPITADLDYYRAFLKILADTLEREGRLRLPLAVPTKQLLRYTAKTDGIKTRREVRTFLKKMVLTGIEGGVYQAKTQDFTEGFVTTVFRQVVVRGETMRHGQIAETNYVWPAAWFLANYLRGYVRRVDLAFHNRLRKPIAKALYPLLATGWYESGGHLHEKRYAALCAEFLLATHRALSLVKQQLDPAHQELHDHHFLDRWAYRPAADAQDWILCYWPGKKFFEDYTVGADWQQRAIPRQASQGVAGRLGVTADAMLLLEDMLTVCGDRQSEAAYRKVIKEHPGSLIRMALAETRQAAHEGRIGKTRGAFFFDTLQRLARLHAP
jgi:hypothetical protein